MANLLPSSMFSSLLPKDPRVALTIVVAGAGALALYLEYVRRERYGSTTRSNSSSEIDSKIKQGNVKLEEAIQYYEAALADMQQRDGDDSQRLFVRSMLLRAYEIQAITSPEDFQMRSTVIGIDGLALPSPNKSEALQKIINPQAIEQTYKPDIDDLESESSGISDFYDTFDIIDEDIDKLDLPTFYKDQLFLHKVESFMCRTNRFEQVHVSSPTEFLVKVQCIRLAMDKMLKVQSQKSFLLEQGRLQTSRLLDIAGADSAIFREKFDNIINYAINPANFESITEELAGRRVPAINLYDVVLDFCLLDSFDDLDKPPAAVTSIIRNTWITESMRKGMLSSAVWGIISSKSRKTAPGGFLSYFYDIMGTLTPSLAWGFLSDDPILHPICVFIRENIESSLIKVFNHDITDYSTVDSLAADIFKVLKSSTEELRHRLDTVS